MDDAWVFILLAPMAYLALVCLFVGIRALIHKERARNELGAHFDQAVAVGNAEGDQ